MAVLHGQGGASPLELTDNGTPVSALIAAGRRNGDSYEAELRRELARIEQDKAKKKADFEAEITEASRAQASGAEIDPIMRLLLQATKPNSMQPSPGIPENRRLPERVGSLRRADGCYRPATRGRRPRQGGQGDRRQRPKRLCVRLARNSPMVDIGQPRTGP
jgi:hypothetical protein